MAEENINTEVEESAGIVPGEEQAQDATQAESSPAQMEETQPKNGVQQRINKITREKHEAQREAAYLRGKLENQQPQAVQQTELDPTDFDTTADYLKAVKDELRAEFKAEQDRERQQAQEAQINATIGQAIKDGRSKYDDFDIVTSQNIYTQDMQQAAMGDNMAEVMYHLGKNPDEALRIASLSPIMQAREIGRIEATITAKPPDPPPNLTNAADPPPKVPSGDETPPAEPTTLKEKIAKWDSDRMAARR